jgi:hypothetical protein
MLVVLRWGGKTHNTFSNVAARQIDAPNYGNFDPIFRKRTQALLLYGLDIAR